MTLVTVAATFLLTLELLVPSIAQPRTIRFGPGRNYASGNTNGACIAAGDLNGDGYPDLVVTDTFQEMTVLLNKGDGTFRSPALYTTDFYVTGCVLLSDFNGDGKIDALVIGGDAADNGLAFFAGNGDGTFSGPVYTQTYMNASALSAALGDLNGDGVADLFVGGNGGSEDIFADGKGDFFDGAHLTVSGDGVTLGDFNGDGNLDAATAGGLSYEINVLLGNGDGTFQSPQTYQNYYIPDGIITGDFNGDGKLDLAIVQANSEFVLIMLGNGDGTFTMGGDWLVGLSPSKVTAADFDKDGTLDLAVSNYSGGDVSVLQGSGNAQFSNPLNLVTGAGTADLVAADFNLDGSLDLAAINGIDNTVTVLPNAAGTFIKVGSTPNPSQFGQKVKLGTAIQGSIAKAHVATGTVIFRDGSTIIARKMLANGKAGFVTSGLSKGTHNITVEYSGNGLFNPSVSPVLVQVVE